MIGLQLRSFSHETLGEAFGFGDLIMLVCLTGDAWSAALQISTRR